MSPRLLATISNIVHHRIFYGADTIIYSICDNGNPSLCDTDTVFIFIDPVNDAPVVTLDTASVNEDDSVVINLLTNDNDSADLGGLDTSSLAIVGGPFNGTVSVDTSTGQVIYTPDSNFYGVDSFQYVVCDTGLPLPAMFDSAWVLITIDPVNDQLIALDDSVVINEDDSVAINVLANDNDSADFSGLDTASVAVLTGPSNGSVSVDTTTGLITYTPATNFYGLDSFQYVVCDTGLPLPATCDSAWVYITIDPVNDAPVVTLDTASVNEDDSVVINLLTNDNDSADLGGLDTSSIAIVGGPFNGTVSVDTSTGQVIYTPDSNFYGVDSFQYVVCDTGLPLPAMCDSAWVVITIDPVNDQLIALDDSASVNEDDSVAINVLANDNDSADFSGLDTASVAVLTGPSNGSVSVDTTTGLITYTPATNFYGLDSFQYVVCDTGLPLPAKCDSAWVYITIDPVNDAPVVTLDTASVNEDDSVVINLLTNDNDSADLGGLDTSSIAIVGGPFNGTVSVDTSTGQVIYTPDSNFYGVDSFQYVVCDTGLPLPAMCDSAWVVITIDPVNDQLIALDDSASVNEDDSVAINVLANDNDSADFSGLDTASVAVLTGPSNGSVSVDTTTGLITYTPATNFYGLDSFQYVVCDTGLPLPAKCDSAWVYITIDPVNDAPVVTLDTASVNEDDSVVINLLTNDNDSADLGGLDTSSIAIVGGPFNGTVSVDTSTGQVIYTPDSNFYGVDSFQYVVCDTGLPLPAMCDSAWVLITIDPVNDQLIALDDSVVLTKMIRSR